MTFSMTTAVLSITIITCFTKSSQIIWLTRTSVVIQTTFASAPILTWMIKAIVMFTVITMITTTTNASIIMFSINARSSSRTALVITIIPRLTIITYKPINAFTRIARVSIDTRCTILTPIVVTKSVLTICPSVSWITSALVCIVVVMTCSLIRTVCLVAVIHNFTVVTYITTNTSTFVVCIVVMTSTVM